MSRPSSSQPPATILVVDDSEVVLAVTKALLTAAGYRVLTHPGSSGCVAVILQENPDLVLIDVNMPKLGGETIVKLFGKAQPNSEAIILLFSSLPAEQLERRAQSSGAHGYIRKTDDSFELLRHVNRWLRPKDRAALLRASAAEPRSGADPQSGTYRRARSQRPAEGSAPPRLSRPPPASGTLRLEPVVLFIDDDMAALSGYRRDVQGEPYRADFALSAQQALRHLESADHPDVIVASLAQSGIDVYERALQTDPHWRARFIFVAQSRSEHRAQVFLDTFDGVVLRRPFDAGQLRAALRRLLPVSSDADHRTKGG
jgi:CheY-like chemotaxis protein